MALLKLSRLGNPVLRQTTAQLKQDEINTFDIQRLIDDMIETMRDSDGVGIAANQVHVSKQIAVIEITKLNPRYPDKEEIPLTVLINPKITSHSKETGPDWEGCLSIPDFRGRVPRWKNVEVKANDRHGNPTSITAQGFFARVIQHEIDHLNGKVYLDRITDLTTLTHLREFQQFWKQAVF